MRSSLSRFLFLSIALALLVSGGFLLRDNAATPSGDSSPPPAAPAAARETFTAHLHPVSGETPLAVRAVAAPPLTRPNWPEIQVTSVIATEESHNDNGETVRRQILDTAGPLGRVLVTQVGNAPITITSAEHFSLARIDDDNFQEARQVLAAAGYHVRRPFGETVGGAIVSIRADTPSELYAQLQTAQETLDGLAPLDLDPVWRKADATKSAVAQSDLYYMQWHLPYIGAHHLWDITTGSSDVIVAVLDTGLTVTPETDGRVLTANDYDFAYNDSTPNDEDGHGTAVANTIAANGANSNTTVSGVNWNCRILPLKILDDDGSGFSSWMTAAIDHAVANGAHLINISAGGENGDIGTAFAVERAWDAGVLVIASSGNNDGGPVNYPAAVEKVLSAGSHDRHGNNSTYDARGNELDLCAPGEEIITIDHTGTAYYYNGTSFSAPVIAGAASLLLSVDPDLTPEELTYLLLTAAPGPTTGQAPYDGWNQDEGWGQLQIAYSYALLTAEPVTRIQSDGSVVLTWFGAPHGVNEELYVIERTTDLLAWNPVNNPQITSATGGHSGYQRRNTWTATTSPGLREFYRVRLRLHDSAVIPLP